MEIKTLIANRNNYGSSRDTSDIKYIVIHYTGNNGDKAVSNAKYFHNNEVGVSAHYFIDENEIYQYKMIILRGIVVLKPTNI